MVAYCGSTTVDLILSLRSFPERGTLSPAEGLLEIVGGSANAAIQSAHLGVETLLVTRLGDDERGRFARRYLEAVPGLELAVTTAGETPLSLILAEPDERTIIAAIPPNDARLEPDARLGDAGHVFVAVDDEGARAACWAASAGRKGLPLRHGEAEIGAGRRWQFAVASDDEVSHATEGLLDALGCELCVVTAGADGGRSWEQGRGWCAYAPADAPLLVDATGAGDCFLAGLLAGLDRGLAVGDAVALGAQVGAAALGFVGGHPR